MNINSIGHIIITPMNPARPPHTCLFLLRPALLLVLWAVCSTAGAQLHLPPFRLPPSLQQKITEPLRADNLLNGSQLNDVLDLHAVRRAVIDKLLRAHPDLLEADPLGAPIVRHEILAWSPSAAGLAAARTGGLSVSRVSRLDGLDQTVYVLQVADATGTALALQTLRAIDPQGVYDFNHIYIGSATSPLPKEGGDGMPMPAPDGAAVPARAFAIGLIDSGVDAGHSVFHGAAMHQWGCGGAPHPAAHGTAVAALMVGQSGRFHGVAPNAGLYAADIYCDSASGGSADQIAQALAWLAREKVAVINLSLVGPPNQLLERAVGLMLQRGHLLVAAVGNDGPAAAPLFPASYPGVVGVSAVDPQRRPLPEAARGPQVMFAAPGSNMLSAALGTPPYAQVRGTSFAAPIVAALLAMQLERPDREGAKNAIARLAKQAVPDASGGAGRAGNASGYGVLGESMRIDPAIFR